MFLNLCILLKRLCSATERNLLFALIEIENHKKKRNLLYLKSYSTNMVHTHLIVQLRLDYLIENNYDNIGCLDGFISWSNARLDFALYDNADDRPH